MTALEPDWRFFTRHRLAPAGIAVAVCLSYYLGSLVGLQLRVPSTTPSVIWPPNAILAAVLILTSRSRWWIVLAAALPAHLFVQLQTEWPIAFIVLVFFTNCLEALIAAAGFRLLSDGVPRLDTFGRLWAFLAAAGVAAPLLSSFADAAIVTNVMGEPYWRVWRFRFFANVLAALTVVPAIIGAVYGGRRWLRRRSIGRAIEAAAIAAGLIGTTILLVGGHLPPIQAIRAMVSQTPEVVQLPFILWAAFRFGPGGTGVTLLLVTLMNAWQVVQSAGPLAAVTPVTTVTAMTLSLIVATVTLLCLATLIEERRQSQAMLAARLRFEELLSGLSRAFAQLPSNRMDQALDAWLARIRSFLAVDYLGVLVVTGGAWTPLAVHSQSSAKEGTADPAAPIELSWTLPQLAERRHAIVTHAEELPEEAVLERAWLERSGLKTVLVTPLVGADGLLGALVCGGPPELPERSGLTSSLRLVGNVLAGILERKANEDLLRKSELVKSTILQSLTAGVVVVDGDSQVLAQNQAWLQLARAAGCVDIAVGTSFLDALDQAAAAGSALAEPMRGALTAVLNGSQARSVLEHTSETGEEARWWSVQVVPLSGANGGAVVTRADITDVRRAELEAQRSRQELAHVARVATVGELTASIAHQLNQPLSAIMTNAQAARRILEWAEPDLEEVRAILSDIVKDDRRASEVIQRVRELLRNSEPQMAWVDLSALIREVADLLSSEAILRDVALSLSFDRVPVYTKGDRVQLQQVVLNLLQNGMEAMSPAERSGRVTCSRERSDHVLSTADRIAVDDATGVRRWTGSWLRRQKRRHENAILRDAPELSRRRRQRGTSQVSTIRSCTPRSGRAMAYSAPPIHTAIAAAVTNASSAGRIRVPRTTATAARIGNQARAVRPSARPLETRTPSGVTTVMPHSRNTSPPRLRNELARARVPNTHHSTRSGRVKRVGSMIRVKVFRRRCSISRCKCAIARPRSADDTDGRCARIR